MRFFHEGRTMQIKRGETLCEQIVLHFQKEIFEGRLKEGDSLPSTQELAKKIGVNPDTVQRSLKRLMRRGLIERTRGRGTFVRKGFSSKCIGLVFGIEIFTNPDRSFFSLFLHELCKAIDKAGWTYRNFTTTEKSVYDKAFHELESSVKSGDVRAVVEFCSNNVVRRWMASSQVPSCGSIPVDYHDLTLKGLEYLVGRGYKDIAVITLPPGRNEDETGRALSEFASRESYAGVRTRIVECQNFQREAYKTAKKLLVGAKRPDALLVEYDTMFRGVIYAVLESGLKFPRDIGLITHSNKGIDLFSHIPLTRLEVDPADFARETLADVFSKIEGRPRASGKIKPVLIPGRTCGEK